MSTPFVPYSNFKLLVAATSAALACGIAPITVFAQAQAPDPGTVTQPLVVNTAPLPPPTNAPIQTAPPTDNTAPTNATAAPPADPGEHKSSRIRFGPELGAYLPTNSRTRSTFGSTWVNVGLGIGGIPRARAGGRVEFDLGLYGTSKRDRAILVAPIGVSYRRALGTGINGGPYAGASADLFLTQLRSDSEGIRSRIRGTGGGSVFLGTTFEERAYVQARYFLLGKIRGYDLSGLNLSTGYRF